MRTTTDTNKRYYWLKLKDDFFRQKEIKQLRKIAGGEVFIIIYLKMLLRSLRDDGKLYYEGIEENFPAELALDIDEDEENVKMTVAYLQAKGILVQCNTDEYELLTAGEMTGSEGYSAERMRRLRGKKLLASHCDALVTASDEEKREKREEKESREKNISRYRAVNDVPDYFYDFYNTYPRHRSKQDAIKAFKALKPNEELRHTIIEDIKHRIVPGGEWYKKESKYIPYPATYLRGRMWEDETEVNIFGANREPDPIVLTDEERAEIDRIYAQNGRDAFM